MQRVFPRLVALAFAVLVIASPATTDGKPRPRPSPSPTPTARPTATPSPTPSPTPTSVIDGIDVSYHQGTVGWPQVAAAGKRFAFVRASAGTLTADSTYATNHAGARGAGLIVGSYHFANPDGAQNDASHEAAWFLQNATIASGDLLPVLDLEVANGLGPASLTAWAQTWLEDVHAATGVRPIIYTSANFWKTSMADTDWFARNGYPVLWIAHWTTASAPSVPASQWGGNGWTFWQHSSGGTVPGIGGPVDLDRFAGASFPPSLLVP